MRALSRLVRRWLWGGLLWGLLAPAAFADALPRGVNLLQSAALAGATGQPPHGMFHGVGYDGSAVRGGLFSPAGVLEVSYNYALTGSSRPQLEIVLHNRSPKAANYTLSLSTQRVSFQAGDRLALSAKVSAVGVVDPVLMTLGWQFYRADGGYLSEGMAHAGTYRPHLGAQQLLRAEHDGGAPDTSTGQIPGSALPRLAVYNIPSGTRVSITLTEPALVASSVGQGVWVRPLTRTLPDIAPGHVLPVSVMVGAVPRAGEHASRLVLRATDGKELGFQQSRRLRFSTPGDVRDVWRVKLPETLAQGPYELIYELPSLKLRQALGTLRVRSDAGMWVGQAIHRYPGISERIFGPIQGDYQFVRSLASDFAHRMQWWTGPDKYDWRGLDSWAQFHGARGKRLVFTFSGSPRWASASPDQYAAMGVPGNAAPPLAHLFPAYERMVKETVTRYKEHILATECWNEPNSRDFFTGTPTELADLCKRVYRATKQVSADIKVICPQVDDPSHLDWVYAAKTSDGEPLHQFCDLVGAHIYNRLAWDANGRDQAAQRLEDALEDMVAMSRKYGISKPLAVTEFGINSCVLRPSGAYPVVFGRMPSEVAAEALYQVVALFREFGVSMMALYSYDHGDTNPECRPGGSFIRMTKSDVWGNMSIDSVVARRVGDAVRDFGHPAGKVSK